MRKPGVKAIVGYKGKICLVLRDNIPTISFPNKWNQPGGGIDENESPFVAMRRELEEELNLKNPDLLYTGTTTYNDGSLVHRFFCEVSDEQFKEIKLLSEGQRLSWFTLDEALVMGEQGEYSPYLDVYLKKFVRDIQSFLDGERTIPETHTMLTIHL